MSGLIYYKYADAGAVLFYFCISCWLTNEHRRRLTPSNACCVDWEGLKQIADHRPPTCASPSTTVSPSSSSTRLPPSISICSAFPATHGQHPRVVTMDFSPPSDVNHHLGPHAHPYNTPQSAA